MPCFRPSTGQPLPGHPVASRLSLKTAGRRRLLRPWLLCGALALAGQWRAARFCSNWRCLLQ